MPIHVQSQIPVAADLRMGFRVDRAAAKITLASVPLFTVIGGRIRLKALVGEVVVTIAATATLVHIDTAPTGGTATALSTDSGDIQGYVLARKIQLPATVAATTLSVGDAALLATPNWVIPVGTINLHGSAAPATGTVKWSMWYLPIDDGAYVEAA